MPAVDGSWEKERSEQLSPKKLLELWGSGTDNRIPIRQTSGTRTNVLKAKNPSLHRGVDRQKLRNSGRSPMRGIREQIYEAPWAKEGPAEGTTCRGFVEGQEKKAHIGIRGEVPTKCAQKDSEEVCAI